jgi:hypothetical protein
LARMIIVSPFPFIFLLLRFYTDGERRFAWEFVQKKLLNIK